jgi:hypothetical protein
MISIHHHQIHFQINIAFSLFHLFEAFLSNI